MADTTDLLDWAARATPIVLGVGAILSFGFREKIKQYFSRSLMRDLETLKQSHARELAELSAKQQRELEAYKVSLIAESERVKAAQEVRKSVALKIGERRFNAIAGLLDAFSGLDIAAAAQAGPLYDLATPAARELFIKNGGELLKRFEKLDSASHVASPFLTTEQKTLVVAAKDQIARMLASRTTPNDPPVEREGPQTHALFQAASAVETNLRDMLHAMEHLG